MVNLYELSKGKSNKIKDFILTNFKERRQLNQETYRNAMLTMTWVRGFQNTDFDIATKQWNSQPRQNWKPRLISNLMLPIVRRNQSQLMQFSNPWDVIPASPDEKDIQISRTSNKILSYYWQFSQIPQLLIKLAWWQSCCGSVFVKVGWDTTKGEVVQVDKNQIDTDVLSQLMELSGITQAPDLIDLNKGELDFSIVPFFNITIEGNAGSLEDSSYLVETNVRSKDWIVDKFGNRFKDLNESSEHEIFLFPFTVGKRSEQNTVKSEGITVHELWVKGSHKRKNGLHCIITDGGKFLVSPEDHPYDHKKLPYIHFLEIYDAANFFGTSIAQQIRSHQARYNRVQTAILEQINTTSNVQWLIPSGSGVQQISNKPGAHIRYKGSVAPSQSINRPMPSFVDRFLDRIRLDMQDTASNHDVSEGKAEPSVRSGKAVIALQDADDSIQGPVLLQWDNAIGKMGRLALETIVQFSDREKIINITGEYGQLESVTFTREVLEGDTVGADYFQVRVKTYGRQPLSRSAREQLVGTLIQTGLLNPQTHREELLHILGAADTLSLYDQSATDRARQFNEIEQMKQGDPVGVYFGQNHESHMVALKKFISGSEWDSLEPQVKTGISEHMKAHLKQQALEVIFQQSYIAGLQGSTNDRPTPGQSRTQAGGAQAGGAQAGGAQAGGAQAGAGI